MLSDKTLIQLKLYFNTWSSSLLNQEGSIMLIDGAVKV